MKWEYGFIRLRQEPNRDDIEQLNDMGQNGWEAVCSYGDWGLIIKRPISLIELDNEWISVEDRLPDPNEEASVIGYDEFYERVGEARLTDYEPKQLVFIDSDDCSITHWQSFPDFGEDQ